MVKKVHIRPLVLVDTVYAQLFYIFRVILSYRESVKHHEKKSTKPSECPIILKKISKF